MRRLFVAASLFSALAIPLVAHADSYTIAVTTADAPSDLGQSLTVLNNPSFSGISETGIIDFTFDPTTQSIENATETFDFTVTLSGAFGTETITQDGTLNLPYYTQGFVASNFTLGTQSISGPDAYSAAFSYDFDTSQTATLYGGIYPTPPAPTPEPGSLVLLGTGLVAMVGAARRRLMN